MSVADSKIMDPDPPKNEFIMTALYKTYRFKLIRANPFLAIHISDLTEYIHMLSQDHYARN